MVQQEKLKQLKEIPIKAGLSLRLFVPSDAADILAILVANPSIQVYVPWTADLASVEDVREKVESWQKKPTNRYAICEGDKIIGYVGLRQYDGYFGDDPRENEYHIGYFCDESKRGRGIVTDAVRALIVNARERLAITTFALYIEDRNTASVAMATRLGFRRTEEVEEDPKLSCPERRWELRLEDD